MPGHAAFMLGWRIIVYRKGDSGSLDDPSTIISWLTGLGGTDWLDAMVKAGRAELSNGGGYPSQYSMLLKDLLPELVMQPLPYQGPKVIGEDYIIEKGWMDTKTVNREALLRCDSDDSMIVDAWDQS